MKGLSEKEIKVIAELEFEQKYYFTKKDIAHNFDNKSKIKDFIYRLLKKGRIVKINRQKYYLIPIKAKIGKWTDNPFIIADQICDSKDYFIGGWAAANYWHLTDQVPMQIDVYTTRRQGKVRLLNNRFVFHHTTRRKIEKAVTEKIGDRKFRIISKEGAAKWLKSKE